MSTKLDDIIKLSSGYILWTPYQGSIVINVKSGEILKCLALYRDRTVYHDTENTPRVIKNRVDRRNDEFIFYMRNDL